MSESLPARELKLFKEFADLILQKKYQQALKNANTILKKFPKHAETLSTKGLILSHLGRKGEAEIFAKYGVTENYKSDKCWQIYGLIKLSNGEHTQAKKCFTQAIRLGGDKLELTKQLAALAALMRDWKSYLEYRKDLMSQSLNRRNFIAVAVAYHMLSDLSTAIDLLDSYEKEQGNYASANERYEHGEILLYKISLLEECGSFDKGLEEIDKNKNNIVDDLAFNEQKVSLLLKLNRLEEAEEIYRILLARNSDNYKYFTGLQKCHSLYSENGQYTSEEIVRLSSLYETLGAEHSTSTAAKRIPLDFLEGIKFQEAAINYVIPRLTEGVPSLFSDLSPLYDHPSKASILDQLFFQLEDSLRTTGCFPGRTESAPPETLMWILLLLSQHFDRMGQYDKALAKINEAIECDAKVIDLYCVKGRILKHAGELIAAAALADKARCMDLADRYLNIKCVKRMLQANQVELAKETALLFTKNADQHSIPHDIKFIWYELASGENYYRQGDLDQALKMFLAVEKHCENITANEFDFQLYSLQKMTPRAYMSLLKFQDHFHSHAHFIKAAAGAIRCYMKLYDSSVKSTAGEEASSFGENLLQVEHPLLEATKYLELIQKSSGDFFETHLLSFELNMRKQKNLLAFQALKRLLELDEDNPDTHRCLIMFFHKIDNLTTPVTESEELDLNFLKAERLNISQLRGKSLIECNTSFFEKHEDSLMHRVAAAEVLFVLEPEKKLEAIKLIEDSRNNLPPPKEIVWPVKEWKLQDCIKVHTFLETVFADPDAASKWKARCLRYFPYSTHFGGHYITPEEDLAASNQEAESTFKDLTI